MQQEESSQSDLHPTICPLASPAPLATGARRRTPGIGGGHVSRPPPLHPSISIWPSTPQRPLSQEEAVGGSQEAVLLAACGCSAAPPAGLLHPLILLVLSDSITGGCNLVYHRRVSDCCRGRGACFHAGSGSSALLRTWETYEVHLPSLRHIPVPSI